MVDRCDESVRLDACLAETETQEINHEMRLEMATGEDDVAAAVLEVSSNTARKIAEGEQTRMAEECRFGGSCLSRDDHAERNPDAHLLSSSVAEEGTPVMKPAVDDLQNDSLFSFGASPAACPTETKTQTTDCRDHAVMDGAAASLDENNMDLLPVSTQEADAVQPGESVASQQLLLHPPNDQTDTEGQERGGVITSDQNPTTVESKEEKMFHSVLRQMQQQQMQKRGRRFKKKTLMKMAKLYVSSKGWESEMKQVTHSDGPLEEHEPLVLNQEEEDMFTSVSLDASQCDAVNTDSLKDDCDEETLSSDAAFSGQTAAPVTLERRKSPRCSKKQKLSGAAETDCSTSTNLLDESQESLLYSRPITRSKKEGKLRKISSVTLEEDTKITRDNSELSRNNPAEISGVDAPNKQRKRRTKTSKPGVKKSRKQKLSPQTFTEYNDVISPIQDTSSNGMDLNAAEQEHDKSETSELTSQHDTIKANSLKDAEKETVLSIISTDATFSGETAASVTVKKRGKPSASKKQGKEESKLSGAAETDCGTSTNLLDESQESLLYSGPITASEKEGKLRTVDSVTLKEDTKITCDNSELSRNNPPEMSSVDAPKKQASKRRKKATKTSKVGVKKSIKPNPLPQTLIENSDVKTHDVSEGFLVSYNEPLLAFSSAIQDTVLSDSLEDGKNDCDKETVSTDAAFSGQTAAPVTLKKRESPRSSKKRKLPGAAEMSTKSDEAQESVLYSRPVTASKNKGKLGKINSVTLKEDAKSTRDNSELSRNSPAEISGVDAPNKRRKRTRKNWTRKVSVKRSTKPKLIPQTITKYNDVKTEDVSDGYLVSRNEPLLACSSSIQDTVSNGMNLNAPKQEHDKSETSELTSQRDAIKINSLDDEKHDCDKETVSTDATFSGQAAAAATLKKRKSVTASKKKGKVSKSSSVALKEDAKITCDNSELSRNSQAEISSVDVPKKHIFKQRKKTKTSKVGVRKSRKQKLLPQTFTEHNDVTTQDVSEGCNEPHLAYSSSIQDTISNGMDLNAADVTASNKKGKLRKISSLTPEEDTKITRDNGELSRNNPEEISSVDAPNKRRKKRTKTSKVGVRKRRKQKLLPQTFTEYNDVISPIQDTTFNGMDLNAAEQEHDKSETSELTSDTIKTKSLEDGKNDCDKETISTDATFSGQTAAPVTLKLRKSPRSSKKQGKEESKPSETAEMSRSPEVLDKSDVAQEPLLYSTPAKASRKQRKFRKIGSVTLEDAKTICDNSKLRNNPAEISGVGAPKKQAVKRRKKTTKPSIVGVKRSTKPKVIPQTFTAYNDVKTQDVSEGFSVSHNEPLLAQDTVFAGMDLNAAEQEHDLISQRDTIRTNSLKDGKNKETISPDATFSGQTEAPVTLKKRKTPSNSKNKAKEESKLSGAAETDCSTSKNLLDVAQESLLISRPVTASNKQRRARKSTSVTVKDDTEIACEIGELSRNSLAEISSDEQKLLPQTSTEHNSKGFLEPPLAYSSSIHDTIFHGMDLNAVKQEDDKSEMSEVTVEAASSFQDEISPIESAVPARKTMRRRQRRNKTRWTARKKLKRRQISARDSNPVDVEMSTFTFESGPCHSKLGDEMIKLKGENERSTVQTLTANTKVKHYDPRCHELKPQKPLTCSFCSRSFRHITALTVHKRIHTGEKPYRCPTCGKRFSQLSQLNVHSRIHGEPRSVCCPCCGETFKSKDELISHFHVHMKSSSKTEAANNQQVGGCLDFPGHNKSFRRSVCFKVFINRATLKAHRRTHAVKPYTCSVCEKKFRKSSSLSFHEKTHWPVKPYSCSVCRESFVKLLELKRHSQLHSGASPFSCAKCEKAFSSFELLSSHQEFEVCSEKQDTAQGSDVDGNTVQTLTADTEVRNYDPLCHGVKSHSGTSPFSCAKCEKAFSSFELLRSHQEFEVCSEKRDAANGNQSGINGFLVSQSVEGQIITPVYFKCLICKQLHRHWCQYILHLQTHTCSKSYTCETCRQEYGQAAGMRSHCTVCCRKSGEEMACRSSLTDTWKEPGAPENQVLESHLHDQSRPPDEDQKRELSVETGEEDMQSPPPTLCSSSLSVNDDFDISASSLSSGFCPASDRAARQFSRFRLRSLIRRHCGRYSCGRCGKSFSRWNKLWLHQHLHRQTSRPSFSCNQCDLEFRFLGSYIDHQREHAAQTPYACPLCPAAFVSEENLSAHVSECHERHDFMKCSACGKNFSTLRNLKKHKVLHKGGSSHFCLPCKASFSTISALKTHLKSHRRRLTVPQPAALVEPLLFPYHCRKCTATFSSADLLQAHQVCHFTAGRKPRSPPESVVSYIPSRAAEDAQGCVSGSSQRKRRLPVSNKKYLFRYPHPDRLYVVPVVSSEPPVVISDTEEERPSITTSGSNTASDSPQRQPGASFSLSNLPQSSAVSTLGDVDGHETGSSKKLQDFSHKSLILPESRYDQDDISDCDSDSAESLLSLSKEKIVVHNCAICTETFTDVSKLHEHYIDHARRGV